MRERLEQENQKRTRRLAKRFGSDGAEIGRHGLTTWSFGDVPERVEITTVQGMPVFGYPGLQFDEGAVSLRLFQKRDDAEAATICGFEGLCELAMQKEFAWLQRDLKVLDQFNDLYVTLGPAEELRETAYAQLRRYSLRRLPAAADGKAFRGAVDQGKARLPGLAFAFGIVSALF